MLDYWDENGPGALWPTCVRRIDTGAQDLTRLRLYQLVDLVRTEPLRHHHEERPAVLRCPRT